MAHTFQLKRGNKADLPLLECGEPAITLDTNEFYIGTDNGNIPLISSESSLSELDKILLNFENNAKIIYFNNDGSISEIGKDCTKKTILDGNRITEIITLSQGTAITKITAFEPDGSIRTEVKTA